VKPQPVDNLVDHLAHGASIENREIPGSRFRALRMTITKIGY
jgi:hypothetical protein